MLERVISGGQTGADQAGWRSQSRWYTHGRRHAERFLDRERPPARIRGVYGGFALDSAEYPARTRRNVIDSDGTIWFGQPHTSGGKTTSESCLKARKPLLLVPATGRTVRPSEAARWIADNNVPRAECRRQSR